VKPGLEIKRKKVMGMIGWKQHNMAHRINAGTWDGSLTRAESSQLRTQLQGIRGAIQVGRADGRLSCPERREIRTQQRELSRDIWEARHNNEGINNSYRPPCGCPTGNPVPTTSEPSTPPTSVPPIGCPTTGGSTSGSPTPSEPTTGGTQSMSLQQLAISFQLLLQQFQS
jgi:hypothetical protein